MKRGTELLEIPKDRNMGFKKGLSGNPGGRPRGAKNKLPRDLVDRVLEISANLEEQGKGLLDCAEKDPRWFFENFLKPMIPKNVSVAGIEPATPAKIEIVFVEGKAHV
jgi:hypothetical protein